MDFLDMLTNKEDMPFSGAYYNTKPTFENSEFEIFDYDIVSPYNARYTRLFSNITTDEKTMMIKTRDKLSFKNKGYIFTQDGELWKIQAHQNIEPEGREVLRNLKHSIQMETVLQLVGVDNVVIEEW